MPAALPRDIADQLVGDTAMIEVLGPADVVIASFGYNDQQSYTTGDASCATIADGDPDAVVFAAVAATTTGCVDVQNASLSELRPSAAGGE